MMDFGLLDGVAFAEAFDTVYSALYSGDELVEYGKAVDEFDNRMRTDDDFKSAVKRFVEYRHDFVSSDRECAAFVLALGAWRRIAE